MKEILLAATAAALLCTPAGADTGFLKGKILKIGSDDVVAERGGSSYSLSLGGLSQHSSVSLLTIERALDKAADDSGIAMVFLNFDHFPIGMAAGEEVREHLRRFSAVGKPVVAYGASLGNASYYVASAADRVFLHPQGSGSLNGMASTMPFVKDLLDTLGIDVQLIRHGKFKSAGEMYIRNDISPENREQYDVLLGSVWNGYLEAVGASRGIPADSLSAWVDGLALGTAQTWLDKGLVDGLKYRDEMEQYLCHLFGKNYSDEIKTVTLREYAGSLKKGPASRKVAVIYADGEIVRSSGDIVGEKLAHEIARVRADSTVKAVVFRVNSPGGEVVAADMIRREIELLGKVKPVIASYGAYAASGGYLISAGCQKIYTDHNTLTGSIGVFGMVPSFGRAIRKNLKVNMVTVGTGAHSGMGSGVQPLTDEELQWYQQEIEGIYDTFVGVVAEGRSMTREAVDSIAQGRVWSGRDALAIGLCDERRTLLDAVGEAARLAGLKKYRIVTYPQNKSFLESLMEKDDPADAPLVIAKGIFRPGFSVMARMPHIQIDNPCPLLP